MPAQTLNDLLEAGVAGRTMLIRSDLNVPLDGETVTDDGRIRAALPTITKLVGAGAKLLVMAHLGRIKDPEPLGRDKRSSLAPVAGRLGQLLDQRVSLAEDVVGQSARDVATAEDGGEAAVGAFD